MNNHPLVKALKRPQVDKLTLDASDPSHIWETTGAAHRCENQVRPLECRIHLPENGNTLL